MLAECLKFYRSVQDKLWGAHAVGAKLQGLCGVTSALTVAVMMALSSTGGPLIYSAG